MSILKHRNCVLITLVVTSLLIGTANAQAGAYLRDLFNPASVPITGNASAAAQTSSQACLWDSGSNKYKLQSVDPTTVSFTLGSTWAPGGKNRSMSGNCRHLLDSACNIVYTFTSPCSDGDACTADRCVFPAANPLTRQACYPRPTCSRSAPRCVHVPIPCPNTGSDLPAVTASKPGLYNVLSHGATGVGLVDDSKAIQAAFNAACSYASTKNQRAIVLFPARRFFLLAQALTLKGPCGSGGVTLQLQGTLLMAAIPYRYGDSNFPTYLVSISQVNGLTITGGGEINGRGALWWDMKSKKTISHPPHMILISNSNNVEVSYISMRNAPMAHLHVVGGKNVHIHHLSTQAPTASPNTDSLGINKCNGVVIEDSKLETGDDNVAITAGSSNVIIRNLVCTSGHGISIGSLGIGGALGCVSNVLVQNIEMLGLQNGLRIKTYQGGVGAVTNVTFQNVTMTDVSNPIVINQFYCDKQNAGPDTCKEQPQGIAISDITFQDIQGTTNGTTGVAIQCSNSVPCQGITLKGIALYPAYPVKSLKPLLTSAYGRQTKVVSPALPAMASPTATDPTKLNAISKSASQCSV